MLRMPMPRYGRRWIRSPATAASFSSLRTNHPERRHGAAEAFQHLVVDLLGRVIVLHSCIEPLADEDLRGRSRVAEAGCQDDDVAHRAVIDAAFETDPSDGRVAH